jgi:hypothetical protein
MDRGDKTKPFNEWSQFVSSNSTIKGQMMHAHIVTDMAAVRVIYPYPHHRYYMKLYKMAMLHMSVLNLVLMIIMRGMIVNTLIHRHML